jgi:signal transduction histidine kinase
VDGDYGQIEEVLTNLLANAARHAPDGTRVAVVARAVPVDIAAGRGSGFDSGGATGLPFSRGAGSRSTGLGLAICRAIVVAHGGTITVEDTPGGGASVVFTLPEHRQVDAEVDPPRRDDPAPDDQPPAVAGIGEDARP